MSIFEAILLGLVQGLTEFIPVSSSGHLLLMREVFGTDSANSLGFDVALHVGTLIALVFVFKHDIWDIIKNIRSDNEKATLAKLLLVATLPAATLGLVFSSQIDEYARSPFIVAVALALVGGIMLIVDSLETQNIKDISMKNGLIIGFVQAIALIPGVSRSGATITAGMSLGIDREVATRFSFLLAIPIITGSALGLLIKGDIDITGEPLQLIVGTITAFISGLFAIKFMLRVIGKVGLRPFAMYRIVLAFLVILFLV